ncbi:NDP-sugar synthase [bacterium]|nr:NDP-sugar synthase [bacterium]
MKAMVMSAGIGTRLRPLTYSIPKPMFPIVNKPVLGHVLELLRKHNIKEVVINLHAHRAMIRNYFGDGSGLGMKINYSEEKKLMGTAGGVKKVEHFFDDTFLVMSGDGLTNINLTNVISFHKRRKAFGTMVLKRIDTRFEYGITLTKRGGRIKQFIEKPTWSSVFSNTVNTGIYVFEPEVFRYIPRGKFCDFARDVWPKLLKRREQIFGYETEEYWCDIGNLFEYRRAQNDALEGKIELEIPGEKRGKNGWIGKGTQIAPGVKIRGPCVIGENCRLRKNVFIEGFSTIGNNSIIGEGVRLRNCILWSGVRVRENVELVNCIIGNNAEISTNISVYEGSVINVRE